MLLAPMDARTPAAIWRACPPKNPAARHRQVEHFEDVVAGSVSSVSEDKDGALRPFPLQVDGDHIGDRTSIELSAAPGALTIGA